MLEVFLATMAFGVACFSLLLVLIQTRSQSKTPLVLLLSCLLLLSSGPIVFKLTPILVQLYISALPLIFFALLPSLWFYQEALIAETYWQWDLGMWKHFSVLPFTLLLGVAIFSLPTSEFNTMFFTEHEHISYQTEALSLGFFFAVIFWCLLSCIYVAKLIQRTFVYRQRLKNMYSNEDGRNLKWLTIVSILILFTWIYALIVVAMGNRLQFVGISENGVLFLLTVIVWLISTNGLRQRPGFEDSIASESRLQPTKEKKTYQRSALTDEHLSMIAEKLSNAISEKGVHLDSDLTLAKLSQELREPTQYISQTLSQILCSTFYDFINQARIEDAKKMLLESERSVIDTALATGFNSRSSFYKAFKQFTGMTPSQFRNS